MNLPTQSLFAAAGAGRRAPVVPSWDGAGKLDARAFTLIEMLVVLAIIGVLAVMTLPSFKNAGKGNITETATRQLMDDLAYARSKALATRTKVWVVFAPDLNWFGSLTTTQTNFLWTNQAANHVIGGQLSAYALYSPRVVGDQPGQSTPRYLTEFRSLPDGAFIPASAFYNAGIFHNVPNSPFTNAILVNDVQTNALPLPFVGFDENGRLFLRTTNLALSIVEGSIMHLKESTGQTNVVVNTDAVETSAAVPLGGIVAGIEYLVVGQPGSQVRYPAGSTLYTAGQTFVGFPSPPAANSNYTVVSGSPRVVQHYGVRIEWVTGRAKVVRPELR